MNKNQAKKEIEEKILNLIKDFERSNECIIIRVSIVRSDGFGHVLSTITDVKVTAELL